MSPFGPYADHADCVAQNGDKANPHAFCAWLEHQITGRWPAELQGMPADAWAVFREAYGPSLTGSTSAVTEAEKVANGLGLAALKDAGWEFARLGWVKQYAAPSLRTVAGVRIFSSGEWTDSQGVERTWTDEDLDGLVKAFNAGVPGIVPVKAGHTADSFNTKIAEKLGVPIELITGDMSGRGQIGLGRMATLERRGSLLFATFERVPEPIADLIEAGLFSTVSVEVEHSDGDHPSALTAVALLGVEEPAVDEATLDRALVFGGKRDGTVVLTFSQEEVSLEVLEAEFKTLKGKMADTIKGMRGAPWFRAVMGQMGTLFDQVKKMRAARLASLEKEGGSKMSTDTKAKFTEQQLKDIAAKFQIDEAGAAALMQVLGLGPDASIEDILAAIEALKAQAGGGGPVPTEAQKTAAAILAKGATEPSEFVKVTSELSKAQSRIAVLEDGNRATEWAKRTALFGSIPGTPEALAKECADIEKSQGKEAAETHFTRLESINATAYQANRVLGTSRMGEQGKTFETAVAEYQKENPKASKGVATKAVMKAQPALYRAYQTEADAADAAAR